MTNQEAIEIIKSAQAQIEWSYPMDYAVAFDMAISALQAQELSEIQKATDTVSRQAAIDAIENTECELLPEEWDELTDAIMNLPSAQPDPQWIPCSERLPEEHGEMYLVTISDGSVYSFALQWDINRKRWYLSFLNNGESLIEYIDDVIAWMPLPEPARLEGE